MSDRYHRQRLLACIGDEGQRRLDASHALIVGMGALGCTVADLLARAGVGQLTIIDRDVVELTNLQRQTLFSEADAKEQRPKALAAQERLVAVNSQIQVRGIVADFSARNASAMLEEAQTSGTRDASNPAASHRSIDVIIDGTDNFETRYLINDLSVQRGVPYVYGGVIATRGMAALFHTLGDHEKGQAERGACLRCVFPQPPAPGSQPTCDTAGVIGPAVSMVGAWQAMLAVRAVMKQTDGIAGRLLEFDVWEQTHRRITFEKNPDCPCCGERRFEFLDLAHQAETTFLCGNGVIQVWPMRVESERLDQGGKSLGVDLEECAKRLSRVGTVKKTPFMVRAHIVTDKVGPDAMNVMSTGDPRHALTATSQGPGLEISLFRDGRAVIKGASSAEHARAVYAKFIGT